MKALVGTGVALVTPFNDDFTVDHDALANLVNFNIENLYEKLNQIESINNCNELF